MNQQIFKEIQRWFGEYAKRYHLKTGKLHPVLQLKVDHCARVAVDARDIAQALGWPDENVLTAQALGLLHDVGRFEQHARFGTFLDSTSVDHGEQGYETARHLNVLAACSATETETILAGIRYHNRRVVPPTLSGDALRFVKLVRDADKVDIIYILNDEVRRNRHKEYPEILLGIDFDGPPTPALIKQIREQRTGSYENVRTLADMNLIRMAWVYDINYLPSLRLIFERKLLEDLLDSIPSGPTAEIRQIMSDAAQYISEKLAAGKMELH